VAAKRAAAVVVFAMNIVGDGAANGDEFSAWCDGQEPAARYEEVEDFGQGDACFAAQDACLPVEGDEALQVCEVERYAVLIEATVTVAAAAGVGEYGLLVRCKVG
jgi:hypothetical protein